MENYNTPLSINIFFKLYVNDFAADTMNLSAEETGMLIQIYIFYWRKQCLAPYREKDVARMLRVPVSRLKKAMAKFSPVVEVNTAGYLDIPGLKGQFAKAKATSKKRQKAANDRWKKEGSLE